MTKHLHMPHPHIAARVAEAFEHAANERLHRAEVAPPRAVPAAADWNDWHHAPAQADWETER